MAAKSYTLNGKLCPACRATKPLSEFYVRHVGRSSPGAYCKECTKDRSRKHYAENKTAHQEYARRRRAVPGFVRAAGLRQYGLTLEQYDTILAAQAGRCAICRRVETATFRGKPRSLSVDHCHKTGRVRGLLCAGCNRGLGFFQEIPARLEAASKYLQEGPR